MASAAEQFASSFNLGTLSKGHRAPQAHLVHPRRPDHLPLRHVHPGCPASIPRSWPKCSTATAPASWACSTCSRAARSGRMTVFALNIMPYISASIIVQLMSSAIPSLEALKKEGETGRKKMNQYTRYLTVLIALVQSYGISVGLQGMHGNNGAVAVANPGWFFQASCVVTLVGGTMFLDVARRTDHRARHRQRHLAHHLLRHRRQPAERPGQPARTGAAPAASRRCSSSASWSSPAR